MIQGATRGDNGIAVGEQQAATELAPSSPGGAGPEPGAAELETSKDIPGHPCSAAGPAGCPAPLAYRAPLPLRSRFIGCLSGWVSL